MTRRKNEGYIRRIIPNHSTILLVTVLISTHLIFRTQGGALVAPTMIEHPPAEIAYRAENEVILPCLANADSNPVYTWKKDNQELDLSGRNIALVIPYSSGHLIIRKPTIEDEGEYQCFAKNEFGTAVTTRTNLKKAFFVPFQTVQDPTIKYPVIGEHLTITCDPPNSYPKDTPYWGISRPGDKKHQTLANDDRILLDYNGHLHFANIIQSDDRKDLDYICILPNTKLGAHIHGNNHRIRPSQAPAGGPRNIKPALMWSSPTRDTAVKGQNKKIKCIFSGFPTPRVKWSRVGKPLDTRMTETKEGFGTELEIANTVETDSGEYECTAVSPGSEPVSHRIQLVIQSKPFWSQGRPPANVEVEEEGSASFTCVAHGTPNPTVTWGINGVSLDKLPSDPRRSLSGGTLSYRNLQKNDTQVIQCIASNTHGTILANAHLFVISAPPSFTKTPQDSKVVQGKSVKFECHANGAPRPVIYWQRGNPPRRLDDNEYRYTIHDGRDLEIKNAQLNDEDDYFCVAENKLETTKAKATLTVRQPTTISESPAEISANRSDDVTLRCDVFTDAKEIENLKIEWRKNGKPVDYNVDRHLVFDKKTFSLTITRSLVKDTAKYNCHANNGLDSAESNPTQLRIKDRPEAPSDLKVDACTGREAKISFLPGSDNNDPITSFTVYYSVDDQPEFIKGPVINHYGDRGNERVRVDVKVQPWRSYTFHVVAENSLGSSELSARSTDKCDTPQMAPAMNPKNVCSKLKGSGMLVITWEAVPREEHYGEGYRYVIGYEEIKKSGYSEEKIAKIADPAQTELTIHDLPVFTRYKVTVWAENNIGSTPFTSRERKFVYSSEGKPLDAPKNFRLNGNRYNGTYGEFIWDPVDTRENRIQGIFRGYRIKFWRANDPNMVRTEDVIIDSRNISLCPSDDQPLQPARRRRQIGSGPVFGSTHKLWPNTKIIAGVTVLNRAHDGTLSNTIEFFTPAGPPEAVKELIVTEKGSSHLVVSWSLPGSDNGAILSYIIEYQVAPPEVGQLRKEVVDDPTQRTRKLLDLQAETTYRVTLYAVTVAGQGEAVYVDAKTLADFKPDQPRISKVDAGVDSANVTFDATDRPPKQNPGSKFYVEYAKEGIGNEWMKTDHDPHNPDNWVQVKDLDPGVYFFRVVAVNGRDGHTVETRSDAMRIEIGEPRAYTEKPREEAYVSHKGASAGWFIALMCIIVLLLIILLIICCIKRSKGDMYPVYEKEKMLGRDPFAPDDAPFGEYNSSGRPDRSRSQGSLDSDDKPMESDTDSLGEYEDQDASKFNEDGSFIGLYGGKGRSRTEPAAPAMNTFV